jgi:diguanylate cyclase (GGDEF)-like protein
MNEVGGTRVPGSGKVGTLYVRGLIFALALAVICVSLCRAESGPLTSLRAIHSLSSIQVSRQIPVAFEATVTYFRSYEKTLFVQDGDTAISVRPSVDVVLSPGDRVMVKGTTREGFKPYVEADSITVLQHGLLPPAVPATFDQLVSGQFDDRLVTVYGVVRDADTVMSSDVRSTMLQLHMDGGIIDAAVDVDNPSLLDGLLDAEVLVTGVASGRFDGKMQQTGILLHVSSMEGVKVLRRAAANPWTLPLTPMDEILVGYHDVNLSRRVRVHGTLTYFQPGSAAVLQDGNKSLWLMTASIAPLHVGDLADATGFPDVHDGFLALTGAEIQDSGKAAPITPAHSDWDELSTSKHLFDLVTVDGKVVAQVRGAAEDEYVLASDGNLFSAIFKHPPSDGLAQGPPPPMKRVPLGSTIRVTGICFMTNSNPFDSRAPFNILMRSPDDIAVISSPPWDTVRNLVRLVGLLLILMLAVSVWVWMLRRRVRQQTAAITAQSEAEGAHERRIAQVEQRRSKILEEISSSQPLSEVVEHITEMVSYILNGVPCWCDVIDGPRLGHPPASQEGLRILSREIPSHSGVILGHLFVALDTAKGDEQEETEALIAGVRLATLAIETRKLYSDLLHRSEYDLLTDMHNRFSLDRFLEEQIVRARERSASFGLVYIDLDEFKLVNDQYGHRVGDLYLQEVSLRMKRQLRTGDMLARLGGDEFAALVSVLRNRSDVEEIAQRLERCFDAPFSVEGHLLRGSASVGIAIYPEDGTTADSLLTAADSAMYHAKNTRQSSGKLPMENGD